MLLRLFLAGKPEVCGLKAIQSRKGKAEGVVVAIDLPEKHSPRRKAGFLLE